MNRVTWNKINPNHQREILRVTQRIASEFDATMPRTTASAMALMQREGLRVNKGQEDIWRTEVERTTYPLIGTVFDRDIYQRMIEILERSRSGQ
jgi:TRAP-type C4-dicarboxylate transport system substrate-binding protein